MAAKTETMTLNGREIDVEVTNWPVEKIHLDLANPRYAHLNGAKDEDDLERAIWSEDDTKDLYQSIKANRGLITPLFVRHDGVVVEGNRRLTTLRHLKRQIDSGKDDKKLEKIVTHVPVKVFPPDFDLAQRAVFLVYEHVVGKKAWPPMNEAHHIWQMNHELGFSVEQLASQLGKSKTYITQKLWAFEKTREYWKFNPKDKDVQRYAYFEEFHKQRNQLDYSEKDSPEQARETLNFVFTGIKDGLFNIDKARDMRHLPKILADAEAKEAFVGGVEVRGEIVKGTEAALRVLEERYPSTPAFQAVKETLDELKRLPHAEYAEIPAFPRKVQLIFALRTRLDEMIDDLGLQEPTSTAAGAS